MKKKAVSAVADDVEVVVENVPAVEVEPKALTVAEACKKLGISEETLRYIADRGDYPVERDDEGVVVGVFV